MTPTTQLVKKAIKIYNKKGIKNLLSRAASRAKYKLSQPIQEKVKNIVLKIRYRSKISPKKVKYNGVSVQPFREVDKFIPIDKRANRGGHKSPSHYEKGLVDSLSRHVKSDDSVIVVGAGLGVTATVAAEEAHNGEVVCYEGDRLSVEHLSKTININDVAGRVRTEHAVIENEEGLRNVGVNDGADMVPPASIPECDVLELDCEGAEKYIIENINQNPRCIIVETHGNRGVVADLLREMDYTIITEKIAEVGPYRDMCERNGIYVLTAIKE